MPEHILILDSSRETCGMLRTALLALDPALRFWLHTSPEAALLGAAAHAPDVMLCELKLPGTTDLQTARQLRERFPAARLIFLANSSDPLLIRQAGEIPHDGLFTKPVNMSALLAAVRAALDAQRRSKGKTAPLNAARAPEPARRGTGALRASAVDRPPRARRAAAPASLVDALKGIRHRLGALAVMLMDASGGVLELAGELPDDIGDEQWRVRLSALVGAARTASKKLPNHPAAQVVVLQGASWHLAAAALGSASLVVLLKPGPAALRLGLAVEDVLLVSPHLRELLGDLSDPAQSELAPQPSNALQPARAVAGPSQTHLAGAGSPRDQGPGAAEIGEQSPPAQGQTPAEPEEDQRALAEFERRIAQAGRRVNPHSAEAFWEQAGLVDPPGGEQAGGQPPPTIQA